MLWFCSWVWQLWWDALRESRYVIPTALPITQAEVYQVFPIDTQNNTVKWVLLSPVSYTKYNFLLLIYTFYVSSSLTLTYASILPEVIL